MRCCLLSLLLPLLLPAPGHAQGWDVFHNARPSMAKLVATLGGGRYFFGSGVALPDNKIITNCHVTAAATSVTIAQGDAPMRASAQHAEPALDLCVLQVESLRLKPAAVRDSSTLRLGEEVYAVGYNRGLGLTYHAGVVEQLYPMHGGAVIRTSASFTTGASGGGLFDAQGNLVGILTFFRTAKGKDTQYFAVPVEWIETAAALEPARITPMDATPFWAEPLDQQPYFLKAATYEVEDRWDDLLSLSREWTHAHPADGHAWAALGKSLVHAGDRDLAMEAFRRAQELGVRAASIP